MAKEMKKVSVRIADVTYTLVSTESEEAILRAGTEAERLIRAVREAHPDLSLHAATVLALVNAIGRMERLEWDRDLAREETKQAEQREADRKQELETLRAQNNILLQETRRAQSLPQWNKSVDEPTPAEEVPDAEPTPEPERSKRENITFVIDPRIQEEEHVDEPVEEPDLPEAAEDPTDPPMPRQTGIEDLFPDA